MGSSKQTREPRLRLVCPGCRALSRAGMRFCGHCGTPLQGASEVLPPPPKSAAGERRPLTVLFCDLVGSTGLSLLLEPEDLRTVLAAYRHACVAPIAREGGSVGAYLGDGIMAYFGYPKAAEDDPRRALRAALQARAAILDVPATLVAAGITLRAPLQLRIGVHTGLAVVGDIGRGRHGEAASIVGDTPNIAARLQSKAEPGGIVASAETVRLAGDGFAVREAGRFVLAGVPEPVPGFEVLGEAPRPLSVEGSRRFEVPFFDRSVERQALAEAWAAAEAGQGGCVLIQAEAGMGKTRLAFEFRISLGRAGLDAAVLACTSEDRAASFRPLLAWIGRELELGESVDPAAARAALRTAFGTATPTRPELQLAVLLDCISAEERRAFEALGRRRRRDAIEAFLAFFETRFGPGTTRLVVVEDLHWADPGTLAVLRALADRFAAGERGLLLLTARRMAKPPDFAGTVLTLEKLPDEDARGLVRALVPPTAPPDLVERIVARTDGVPLFAEEVARLTATELQAPTRGRRETIPLSLRGTLAAQLDRLGRAKQVAQIAAALGPVFQRSVLEALVDEDERPRLTSALARLSAANLIEPAGGDGTEPSYAFRHSLIRDAAYDSVVREGRLALHRQIGEVLRTGFSGSVVGEPEVLAHHFRLAGLVVDAAEAYEQAAARAAGRTLHADALDYCRAGLQQLAKAPDGAGAAVEVRLQILLAAQLTAIKGNADPEVGAAFTRALALAEQLDDERRIRRALRGLHTYHLVRGEIDVGLSINDRILARSGNVSDPGQRIQLHRPHGLTLLYLGRFAEARRELLTAISLYDPERHAEHRFEYGSDPLVLSRAHLSWALWFLGERGQAAQQADAAVATARRLEHAHSLAFALAFQCCVFEFEGDARAAEAVAGELLRVAERYDYAYWAAWAEILLGWAEAEAGELARGLTGIERGVAAYRSTGAGLLVPYADLLTARLLRGTDRERARRMMRAGLRRAQKGSMGIWQAWRERRG